MCNHIPDAMNIVAKKSLNWKSPIAQLTRQTPDISNFRFHWWEPIWFLDSNKPFFERMRPGFYLSITHATGDEFCYNVQPCWKPKEEMPKVLQRGVVLPRYPNETFIGGVERPISGSTFPIQDEPAPLPPPMIREGAPQTTTLPPVTPGDGVTTLPLAKAGGGEEEPYLDKMETPVKSRKRGAEPRQSQSDSEDEGIMDNDHIPTGVDSDHPDSDWTVRDFYI